MDDDTAAQRVRDQAVPDDMPVEHTNVFEGGRPTVQEALNKAIRKLSRCGWSVQQIARDLNLPEEEISSILGE